MDRLRASGKTLLLIAVAILVAAGTVAVASIPGGDGVITACWNNAAGATYGALRVIDPSLAGTTRSSNEYSCQSNETQIAWNQQGPAGPAGPTGLTGPGGAQGPQGEQAPSSGLAFQASGSKAFLMLKGVKGESKDTNHKGEIELRSVSIGGAGGGSAKKTGEIVIVKHTDTTSPKLFQALVTGKHFAKATISFATKSKGKQVDYLKFKMKTVLVTSIQNVRSSPTTPNEQVTLTFGKIAVEYLGRHSSTITLTPHQFANH